MDRPSCRDLASSSYYFINLFIINSQKRKKSTFDLKPLLVLIFETDTFFLQFYLDKINSSMEI